MTTKDKIVDILLNTFIWMTLGIIFESFTDDGFTQSDFSYWFGVCIGYIMCVVMNKIVKKDSEEEVKSSNMPGHSNPPKPKRSYPKGGRKPGDFKKY